MNNAGVLQKTQIVELEGRGALTLRPADHLATGGEGSVYKPSPDTIIKIYSDPQKMMHDGMPSKINLLKKITHPFIVSPKGLVLQNQTPIGFYMAFESGEALARIFTTAYCARENFSEKDGLNLVDGMRTVVSTAHKNKAVLVDANELNWLVSRKGKLAEPRIIDVDSWAIGSWKPSVIMPSIRDWHSKVFNEQSDWFSYAVVSFQVFSGIHPYKGMLTGYKPNDMEQRMKDNRSVFTPGIRLNNAVRDFSKIPAPLLSWYEAVFQQGERSVPPSPFDTAIKTPKMAIVQRTVATASSGLLVMDVLFDGVNDVPVQVYSCGVARLRSGKMVNLTNGKVFGKTFFPNCEVVRTEHGFLIGEINNGNLSFTLVNNDGKCELLSTVLQGTNLLRYYNRMFVVTQQGLTEISVKQFAKPTLITGNTWQVLINSTKWFDGVGVQDAMGTTYLVAPFGEASLQYAHVPELDKSRVIQAVAGNRCIVLVVLENKTGQYKKYELVFNKDYTSYDVKVEDMASPELNIALLPAGVNAEVVNDGSLIITVPVNGARNEVADAKIDTSFALTHWEKRVLAIHGSKIWAISLKS